MQLEMAEPVLLLAVRCAKLAALTVVKLAATAFVAFCLLVVPKSMNRGTASAAIITITTTTMINSISVKPDCFLCVKLIFDYHSAISVYSEL